MPCHRFRPLRFWWVALLLLATVAASADDLALADAPPPWLDSSMALLQAELTARFGAAQRPRVRRGLAQTARFWRAWDGGADVFEAFVRAQYQGDDRSEAALLDRLEPAVARWRDALEALGRDLRRRPESGPEPAPAVEGLLAGLDPAAHLAEDAFRDKLAFAVLLNFPRTTPAERRRDGGAWSSRQWAEARLAEPFGRRAPAEASLAMTAAAAEARLARPVIHLERLVDAAGTHPFPPGTPPLDAQELPAAIGRWYRAGAPGLVRQRMLQRVAEAGAAGKLPAGAWPAPGEEGNPDAIPAPDPSSEPRCGPLLAAFQAARRLDPFAPEAPTQLARSCDEDLQVPEARVRELLEAVCSAPAAAHCAGRIRFRLGRALEPFDLWHPGLATIAGGTGAAAPRRRHPDAAGFLRSLPRRLRRMGFSRDRAAWLASQILASGTGPAAPAPCGPCGPRLRIAPGTLDDDGYLAALRATGRAVAELLARAGARHPLLAGVPDRACGEALALAFQARALEVESGPGQAGQAANARALDAFWRAWAAAGPALVAMDLWRWLYEHPQAEAAQLTAAAAAIARQVWNRSYAPVLGGTDSPLLAWDSRLVEGTLTLADEPLARIITVPLQRRLAQSGRWADGFERMARLGRLSPELWLERAAGAALEPGPLLQAVEAQAPPSQPIAHTQGGSVPANYGL